MEIWADIKGYEGHYQISSEGRLKSLKFEKERIMQPVVKKSTGYYQCILRRHGVNKSYQVHQLVAQAFLPQPTKKHQVNHKNKDRRDNRLINLEYCTPLENSRHRSDLDPGIATFTHPTHGTVTATTSELAALYNLKQDSLYRLTTKRLTVLKGWRLAV